MAGRKYSAATSKYRYGFNGKENDNDVKGVEGGQQDYGMRIYDPRLGRFLSVDPLADDYSFNSPYAFAENDVISSIDLDGQEKIHYSITFDDKGKATLTCLKTEDFYEWQWSPGGTGIFNWWLWKEVKNPKVEHVVHHQDSKQVHQWGNFTTIDYDETVTYKSLPEAQKATEKDFETTSGDDAIIRKQIWLAHQEDVQASGGGGFGNYISGGRKGVVNAIQKKVVQAESKAIVNTGQGVTKAQNMVARLKVVGGNSAKSAEGVKWNLGEAVVNKKHHNWNKIFGKKVVTLSDVEPILQKAVSKGRWQTTGVIRGKGGKIIGDKLELIQYVKGQKIWVGGMNEHSTGKIIINNGAVK
jgi:RHS repeat-associated protein